MIWPTYAISVGEFSEWIEGIVYQAVRESVRNLRTSILLIFEFDPIILLLGGTGIIYSVVKGTIYPPMGTSIPCLSIRHRMGDTFSLDYAFPSLFVLYKLYSLII